MANEVLYDIHQHSHSDVFNKAVSVGFDRFTDYSFSFAQFIVDTVLGSSVLTIKPHYNSGTVYSYFILVKNILVTCNISWYCILLYKLAGRV